MVASRVGFGKRQAPINIYTYRYIPCFVAFWEGMRTGEKHMAWDCCIIEKDTPKHKNSDHQRRTLFFFSTTCDRKEIELSLVKSCCNSCPILKNQM